MKNITDFKCSITSAIISVLVFLLLLNLGKRAWGANVGGEINNVEWYKSMEIILLFSIILGYNLNTHIFGQCSTV